jgi:hypothetical protein
MERKISLAVEYRSHQYSEHCKAGIHFKGIHQMSLMPVE